MALELFPLVLNHAEVPPAHKLVLMGIANHERDGKAWPSVARLATYAGIGERRTQEILRELEDMELIRVTRRKGKNGTNVYALNISCPADCDRSPNHLQGVNYSSPGGELQRVKGVSPSSPEPVILNQYLTTQNRNKRERDLAHTRALLEEAQRMRDTAEPMPTCEHGLRLIFCRQCTNTLNDERKSS